VIVRADEQTAARLAEWANAPHATLGFSERQLEVQALLAELARAEEEIRIREESQIPMIPRGAQRRMEQLEAELARVQEAHEQTRREVDAACEALSDEDAAFIRAVLAAAGTDEAQSCGHPWESSLAAGSQEPT
jgi:hypothetical protein